MRGIAGPTRSDRPYEPSPPGDAPWPWSYPMRPIAASAMVYAADHVHNYLQRLDPVGQVIPRTRRAGRSATECGVGPLDVRRVDLAGPSRSAAAPGSSAPGCPRPHAGVAAKV